MKGINARRLAGLLVAAGLIACPWPAAAGVLKIYFDRPGWEAAAAGMGLVVTTDDFSIAPPFPSNPRVNNPHEWATSGLGGSVYFDNLSVATGATAVPAPGTLALFAIGLLGFAGSRRRLNPAGS